MLEGLTPSFVIVLLACSCLLVLGFVYSFYAYFVPYLRYRRYPAPPILPQSTKIYVDADLQRSLYSLPNLLHHIPRSSLAECEIQSSRWSINILEMAPTQTPRSPASRTLLSSVTAARRSSLAACHTPNNPSHMGPGCLGRDTTETGSNFADPKESLNLRDLYSISSVPGTSSPDRRDGRFPSGRRHSSPTLVPTNPSSRLDRASYPNVVIDPSSSASTLWIA